MPTYDFACKECKYKFNIFCSISSKDKQICPQCGSNNIKQRITGVNINGSKGNNNDSSSKTGFG